MSSERPSHSVVMADARAVGIAALGHFSSYLAEYDKVSTYQYMPTKSTDDLSKDFGKNALEPINALLSSEKPEEQALGREKVRQLNTLLHTMRDRFTYDGNVTVLGLDPDVIEIAKTVKDPKLRERLAGFRLAGHQLEEGRDDMWDALRKDGIPPKEGSDFGNKLIENDYDKVSPKGYALLKQGITPVTAESFTREFQNDVINDIVSYRVEKTGIPTDRSDVMPAMRHLHKDENTKKLLMLGKMPVSQALSSAAEKTKTTITGLSHKEEFFKQAQAQAKSKSSGLEEQRQARVAPTPTPPEVRVKPPQPKGPRPPKGRQLDSMG